MVYIISAFTSNEHTIYKHILPICNNRFYILLYEFVNIIVLHAGMLWIYPWTLLVNIMECSIGIQSDEFM